MGGGATDQCLEGNPYPVQLYYLFNYIVIIIFISKFFLIFREPVLPTTLHAANTIYTEVACCCIAKILQR